MASWRKEKKAFKKAVLPKVAYFVKAKRFPEFNNNGWLFYFDYDKEAVNKNRTITRYFNHLRELNHKGVITYEKLLESYFEYKDFVLDGKKNNEKN